MKKASIAALMVASLMMVPAAARADGEREATRAACSDGRDNDGDGHVDCADQDCQEFAICVAPPPSGGLDQTRLRGRGTMRVVIGAVVLSLGIVVGGTSALPFVSGGYDGWKYGVAMDAVGLSMIGAGTAVLAVGAADLAMARRPRVAWSGGAVGVRF